MFKSDTDTSLRTGSREQQVKNFSDKQGQQ